MDKAVKKKVSEAVKKKLKELQGFVADELPEYIMVMIANRKTKMEIKGELEVFLGDDSGRFATWLVNLLEDSKCFLDDDSKSLKSKPKPVIKKESEDAEAILSLNPQYHEAIELILKDDLELSLPLDRVPEKIPEELPKKVAEETPAEKPKLSATVPEENSESQIFPELKLEIDKRCETQTSSKHGTDATLSNKHATDVTLSNKHATDVTLSSKHATNVTLSSKHTSKKTAVEQPQKFIGSSTRALENGGEYDPLYPSFNSSQPSEKKPSIPLNFQANKLLLFKAVDDANASICGKDKISHVYKPTPIKVLADNKKKVSNTYKKVFSHKEEDEWETMGIDEDSELVWCEKSPVKVHHNLVYPPIIESNSVVSQQYVEHQREVLIKAPIEVPEDFFFVNEEDIRELPNPEPYPSPVTSPQFVVTLDGVPKTLKRTYSDTLSEKSLPENADPQEVSTVNEISELPESLEEKHEELAPKRQKLLERCRFWPACKNNEDCDYHHPSVLCKAFPNCKFGDKCLYIHPNCKFDSRCTRKDCSYTHVGKRDFLQMGPSFHIQPRKTKPVPVMPPLCKFYPNCSVYHCPFLHPNKKCRFGADCNASNCPFFHQNFPSRKQLKWTPGSS